MCARLTLSTDEQILLQAYDALYEEEYKPSWNTAPGMASAVITADEPNVIHNYHFGLVPHWATERKIGYNMVNARVETIMDKPSFRPLMIHNKRCLVLADGFYEWEQRSDGKQPHRFMLKERPVFAFAGLWSQWLDAATKQPYRSFAIVTTTPNKIVGRYHNRMPVILSKEEEKLWLTDGVPMSDLLKLCDAYPDKEMESFEVVREVNKAVNNYAELILPQNSE